MHKPKYSKTLKRLAAKDGRVESYEFDQDGHWLILALGFAADTGAHCIRGDTVHYVLNDLCLVAPCNCNECSP